MASGVPETILLAPDSFKGTFSSEQVARALARGLAASGPPAEVCPLADGGEGTLSVLAAPLGLEHHTVRVSDPLGRAVDATFGLGPRGVAVAEAAAASGLGLVAEGERDALAASTYGTGELIAAALAAARTVYVTVGGSATTDGGVVAVQAILERGGLRGARLVVLCDVRTPFERAAAVFAPQKGASPEQVVLLSARLEGLALSWLPRDPRGVAMTGAGGGLAGGLWAHFGAELVAGAPFVLDAVGYDARMRRSLAVITGEGSLDRQSLVGKLVSEAATRARQAGVPCHAVVGRNRLSAFDLRIVGVERRDSPLNAPNRARDRRFRSSGRSQTTKRPTLTTSGPIWVIEGAGSTPRPPESPPPATVSV
jgi:glycerate kinase